MPSFHRIQGNTEETLESFQQLMQTGARVIVVASGGKLIELANEHNLDFIQVPGNWPSPRACLGYSLVQQLCILEKFGLIDGDLCNEVTKAATLINRETANIKATASRVAPLIAGKIPVIYTTDRMESVAVRFRQQLNENAKMLCWHHIVPEMNHNELVGWRDSNDNLAVLYFRNKNDYPRNKVRIDINKEIIRKYTPSIIEVFSKGESLVQQALYLVHLGDWISVYVADIRKMDSIEVNVIDYLKGELSKFS